MLVLLQKSPPALHRYSIDGPVPAMDFSQKQNYALAFFALPVGLINPRDASERILNRSLAPEHHRGM
jgi:hypothetical protein